MKISYILPCLLLLLTRGFAQQLSIQRVAQMPDLPSPYEMRDWKQVTRGYDSLIFSLNAEGQYLPLMSLGESGVNDPEIKPVFLDSYVGSSSHGQQREAINIIPAIVGATLVGVDKTDHYSTDWVEKVRDFYNLKNGELVYLNGPADRSGHDWWYETMPNVFFYQLYDLYPDVPEFAAQFWSVADRWLEAVQAMGGSTTPWTVPEMNYRAWNLKEMKPLDAGVKEPEAAGAIAWILYHAYLELGDQKYLAGAQLALDFLNGLQDNPSYELQLPYGVLTAAKMNAELGSDYAVEKMLDWCFSRGDLRGWGSIVGTWAGKDVSGLIGEANDQGNDYAFLMNGFQQAAALVPLVKYDKRFAAAIGKWVLNVANASRLFYAPWLEAGQQSDHAWSTTYDPKGYIAYEGLKESWQGTALYARGDAKDAGWAATNLGLYGSSHVGYLGALLETTDVAGILKLDVNATDFFSSNPFPAYLLYNPHETDQQVNLQVAAPVDLYDAISETVIESGVSGDVPVTISAKGVLLISYLPPESSLEQRDGKLWLDDQVLDYHYGYDFTPGLRVKSLSASSNPTEVGVSDTIYSTLNIEGLFTYQWLVDGVVQSSDSASLVWVPEQVGPAVVRVVVQGEQDTASDSLILEVVELIPEKPVITALKAGQKWYEPETEIWVTAEAYDPKDLPVSYVWSVDRGEVLEARDDSVKIRLPVEAGITTVQLTVTNTFDLRAIAALPVLVKAPVPDQSPLVYLPLDGHVKDRSGNGYETSVQGTTFAADPLDVSGRALLFRSATDELRVTNQSTLNFTEAISVSFWLNATDFAEERFIVSHGGWEQRWKVSVTTDQKLRWTINTTDGVRDLDTSFPLEQGSWYHFVAVYTGEVMELYADGDLDTFTPHTGNINPSDADLTVGKRLPGDNNYFLKGSVDEVKVFDQAIGPGQVALLWEQWWEGETLSSDKPTYGPVLYPNPAGHAVYLRHDRHPGIITIVDIAGKVICTKTVADVWPDVYVIDLAGMASGVYMLQFGEASLKLLIR